MNRTQFWFAAGNLHIGLGYDYLKCVALLINVKRFFSVTESYGNISDKLAVAAMKGVQFDQFEEAYKTYKETVTINQNSLVDYLSALITLIKAGEKPQKAGESLVIIMNKLIENEAENSMI
ncbi:hypothetical protein [Bacillus subtilis]|uniref:hypothetical protein n=1 Tax=Bacillus subtilis TaxID=1423 RepID=UPI0039E25BEA